MREYIPLGSTSGVSLGTLQSMMRYLSMLESLTLLKLGIMEICGDQFLKRLGQKVWGHSSTQMEVILQMR
jgi:hypothetical protein